MIERGRPSWRLSPRSLVDILLDLPVDAAVALRDGVRASLS